MRINVKKILIAFFSLCIFPVGCRWIPLLNGGKFMHTANEPTRTNNPLDFQGGGIEPYNKMVVPRLGSSGVRALFAADDHLSTTLVQRWINDIDAMLRKKIPKNLLIFLLPLHVFGLMLHQMVSQFLFPYAQKSQFNLATQPIF